MADIRQELTDLFQNIEKYLMQQQDLFGNTLPTGDRVRTAVAFPVDEPWGSAQTPGELEGMIHDCLKCGLGHTRTNFVFGVGNPKADVMFIGEAPGADEDLQGEPFVGRAGQLLNKIIEAVDMRREEVYICNILKCRPPNNRDPQPTEMTTCSPYLLKQIDLIRPKFIICLGRISAQWLLQTSAALSELRGTVHDFRGARLIVTYHPAALLRNPNWKRPAWEDMKLFKRLYDAERTKVRND